MKRQFKFDVTVRKGGKIFWGVLFLLGAAAFIVSRLGLFEGISFWSILLSIGLLAILINSLAKRSFEGILFSLAFLVIVNDELLHLEAITPWPVLGAALLGTIGLNLLFPGFRKRKSYKLIAGGEHGMGDTVSDGRAYYENAFGSTVKYIVGEISQVHLDNAFGAMEVYFSDAILKEHRANVNIDSAFGKVTLYVPNGWNVVNNNMEQAFCGVHSNCQSIQEDGAQEVNTLYVSGELAFGAMEIRTI